MTEQEFDTELIECKLCKQILNGINLWVVLDSKDEPMTICDECHKKQPDEDDDD